MNELEKKIQQINRRIGQLIKKGERDVAKKYAATLTEIRSILAEQFEKYEQGGELTLEEMLKHDRLTKTMQRVNWTMRTHYKDLHGEMDRIIGGAYQEGYYLTAWAIETETKTKLGFSAVSSATMDAMLTNPINGLTLNDRLQRQRANIIYDIQQKVTVGLQKNQTYSSMAKELKKSLEDDAVKAMRIVRTEGHRVQEEAKLDAADRANEQGVIMMKEWNTLEDERVRRGKGRSIANHARLNSIKIPLDETFSDGLGEGLAPGQLGAAGSDINCRCFLTYSVEKVEKKTHAELEGMAFKEWEKERLK